MLPVNQNNLPLEENAPPEVGEMSIGMTTYLVNHLKEECDARARNVSHSETSKWVLVAIGVTCLVLEMGFFIAAFASSMLFFAQIGFYFIPASVLCFSLIPLFAPTDYEKTKELIDRELVEFAQDEKREGLKIVPQGKIELTPENIPLYHEVMRLSTNLKNKEQNSVVVNK